MRVFAALADPTRQQIVELLAGRDMAAGEVARHFVLSRAAVSQHLQHLLEAGLVRVRIDGQRRIYSFDVSGFDEAESWFDQCREQSIGGAKASG